MAMPTGVEMLNPAEAVSSSMCGVASACSPRKPEAERKASETYMTRTSPRRDRRRARAVCRERAEQGRAEDDPEVRRVVLPLPVELLGEPKHDEAEQRQRQRDGADADAAAGPGP